MAEKPEKDAGMHERGFLKPDPAGKAWAGRSGRNTGAESDVPSGEREATEAEMREAVEHDFGTPSGHRGDLGDTGPGED